MSEASLGLPVIIDEEAIRLLGDLVDSHLHEWAAASDLQELGAQCLFDLRCRILLDLGDDIFEVVTTPTGGAGEHVLGLRISRTLKRDVTCRAFDLMSGHRGGLSGARGARH